MPQQMTSAVENNFTGGLKTEFTGLNFPENAATDTDNCEFSLIGEVSSRPGIDFETSHTSYSLDRTSSAFSEYKWKNVAGNGSVQILVKQVGRYLYFYRYSDVTNTNPLSATKLASVVDLHTYQVGAESALSECQFADGNGFLFVFNPSCEPFYCLYTAGTITTSAITLNMRDFSGVFESTAANLRPPNLTTQHNYNLLNQGWSTSPQWVTRSVTSNTFSTGSKTFTVTAGLPIVNGTNITGTGFEVFFGVENYLGTITGTVTSYVGTTLTVNITSFNDITGIGPGSPLTDWIINPVNLGLINTWNTAEGTYPSNSDVWWRFKDSSGLFAPATVAPGVTLGSGPAPKGFHILNVFRQDRSGASAIAGLDVVSTTARPSTGTWFQGRVWYSGINGYQAATGTALTYNWSETIYFSQVVEDSSQFGMCYQNNDPTDEQFFDLLPTDGGTITIQGCGKIYKLFPIQNGLLVHAANGIWFITGSQGIGFSANDYTITKISSVECISGSSFVDIMGYPVFWNEEGIYQVQTAQQGNGLIVQNLCWGTILSFYAGIPTISKMYARGDYNPLDFQIKWVFRSEVETSVTTRYEFNRVLTYNTANKAFYPYTVDTSSAYIHGVQYINITGNALTPDPVFKYTVSTGASTSAAISFAEEKDRTNWVDFYSIDSIGKEYDSYFVTGYKLAGKALTKFQPIYLQVFSNADVPTAYKIQGIWDYANSGNSGRYSTIQMVTNALSRFGIVIRKHKIRGRGLALQFKVQSVSGLPFNIIGWSSTQTVNAGM